jgi:hypothetical protein
MNSYVTEEEISEALMNANKRPTSLPEAEVLIFKLK